MKNNVANGKGQGVQKESAPPAGMPHWLQNGSLDCDEYDIGPTLGKRYIKKMTLGQHWHNGGRSGVVTCTLGQRWANV